MSPLSTINYKLPQLSTIFILDFNFCPIYNARMFGEENNSQDMSLSTNLATTSPSVSLSYSKTNKLVTALYMVTDIIDPSEPIRHELRQLGMSIISDTEAIRLFPSIGQLNTALSNTGKALSMLEVASTIRLISEMNYSILKNEFTKLHSALSELTAKLTFSGFASLSDYIGQEDPLPSAKTLPREPRNPGVFEVYHAPHDWQRPNPIGHASNGQNKKTTRIGVQKADTLLNVLKDINVSDKDKKESPIKVARAPRPTKIANINSMKERRAEILSILKGHKGGMTISDIRTASPVVLKNTSEKTLQRELVAMVSDKTLRKEGTKRWSKYFLNSL